MSALASRAGTIAVALTDITRRERHLLIHSIESVSAIYPHSLAALQRQATPAKCWPSKCFFGRSVVRICIKDTSSRGTQGFTIAEILVSLVTIAIGTAGLMASFCFSLRVMEHARDNLRATQIMLEKAETIRLYSWDQVNSNGFIPSTFTATYDGGAVTNGNYSGTIYTGTLAVTAFPFSTSYKDQMRQLTVTLNWKSHKVTRTRSLSTYISKDGIQNYVY
jgi:hypothetical protein